MWTDQERALQRDVGRLRRMLGELPADGRFRQALGPRFSLLFDRLEGELKKLRESAEKAPEDPTGEAWRKAWTDLREASAKVQRFAGEFLRALEGDLLRERGLDRGFLELSDGLLNGLSRQIDIRWPRVSIAAQGEMISGLSEVVGMRFPRFDIWSLPLAVHELGHYVARYLAVPETGARPFDRLLSESRLDLEKAGIGKRRVDREISHLHEFFADLFAVWFCGPAFVRTAVLTRFDPSSPAAGGQTHPADWARCEAMLVALDALDPNRFKALSGWLRKTWREAVETAGGSNGGPGARDRVHETVTRITECLEPTLPKAARFGGWHLVARLSAELSGPGPVREIDVGGVAIVTVLNAAWHARLQDPRADVERLERRSFELAERAAN